MKNNKPNQTFQRLAILSFMSVVELLDPNFVLVENVPVIAKCYVLFFLRCFLDLGYQCIVNIIQGAAFGVPQCRSR
jgi:site-specific DNA-cytosine methylase